jgi:hypothetical protein
MPRIFSYKMTHDTGFAPNPFWKVLTLATCKPLLRKKKNIDNYWIAGFTSKELCKTQVAGSEKLIYLMKISKRLLIADYYRDEQFRKKIPVTGAEEHVKKVGDNIYKPITNNPNDIDEFIQIENSHHWDRMNSRECLFNKKKDLSGRYVLTSNEYYYFGEKALDISEFIDSKPNFNVPKVQAGHGVLTTGNSAIYFIEWVKEKAQEMIEVRGMQGVYGLPHYWPENDKSSPNRSACCKQKSI